MAAIAFKSKIQETNGFSFIHLPGWVSKDFSSRGMIYCDVVIAGKTFRLPLEPDGMGSHWFYIDDEIIEECKLSDTTEFEISVAQTSNWSEPRLPSDMEIPLNDLGLIGIWEGLTTKAKWQWFRWIRFAVSPATRKKRIDILCEKMKKGIKRPCCFDYSRCTDNRVCKSGVLDLPNM